MYFFSFLTHKPITLTVSGSWKVVSISLPMECKSSFLILFLELNSEIQDLFLLYLPLTFWLWHRGNRSWFAQTSHYLQSYPEIQETASSCSFLESNWWVPKLTVRGPHYNSARDVSLLAKGLSRITESYTKWTKIKSWKFC